MPISRIGAVGATRSRRRLPVTWSECGRGGIGGGPASFAIPHSPGRARPGAGADLRRAARRCANGRTAVNLEWICPRGASVRLIKQCGTMSRRTISLLARARFVTFCGESARRKTPSTAHQYRQRRLIFRLIPTPIPGPRHALTTLCPAQIHLETRALSQPASRGHAKQPEHRTANPGELSTSPSRHRVRLPTMKARAAAPSADV